MEAQPMTVGELRELLGVEDWEGRHEEPDRVLA